MKNKTAIVTLITLLISTAVCYAAVIPQECTDKQTIQIIRDAIAEFAQDRPGDFAIRANYGENICKDLKPNGYGYIYDIKTLNAIDSLPESYYYAVQRKTKRSFRLVIRDRAGNVYWSDDGILDAEYIKRETEPQRTNTQNTINRHENKPREIELLIQALYNYRRARGDEDFIKLQKDVNLVKTLMTERDGNGAFLSPHPFLRDKVLSLAYTFEIIEKTPNGVGENDYIETIEDAKNPFGGRKIKIWLRELTPEELQAKEGAMENQEKEMSPKEERKDVNNEQSEKSIERGSNFVLLVLSMYIGNILARSIMQTIRSRAKKKKERNQQPSKPEYTDV